MEWDKIAVGFKPGNVVMLNSGGPPMTLSGCFNNEGEIECQWFVGAILQKSWAKPCELTKIDLGGDLIGKIIKERW